MSEDAPLLDAELTARVRREYKPLTALVRFRTLAGEVVERAWAAAPWADNGETLKAHLERCYPGSTLLAYGIGPTPRNMQRYEQAWRERMGGDARRGSGARPPGGAAMKEQAR